MPVATLEIKAQAEIPTAWRDPQYPYPACIPYQPPPRGFPKWSVGASSCQKTNGNCAPALNQRAYTRTLPARGGIIHEQELAAVLRAGHLGGVAIDVFEREPYSGELAGIERCVLMAHMGSMSVDCRSRMEIEAKQEAVRFVSGQQQLSPVPPEEYEVQRPSE